jgi:hypothetical protein
VRVQQQQIGVMSDHVYIGRLARLSTAIAPCATAMTRTAREPRRSSEAERRVSDAHLFVKKNQIVPSRRGCYAACMNRRRHLLVLAALGCTLLIATAGLTAQTPAATLVGTWTLSAADDLKPDGTRSPAYGPNPQGLLTLGADGRYSVQIFRSERLKFASGDKRRGTLDEYKDASLGMSSHFGRYIVDSANGTIAFQIERASFPNWDGATQVRPFKLEGDELSWRVPATPDGTIPISVWRRAQPAASATRPR